ncbi:MAG: protein kinase [Vicinamibacteria bacterium]|nr:protein kinase [Vicinamibacteria bacterium]
MSGSDDTPAPRRPARSGSDDDTEALSHLQTAPISDFGPRIDAPPALAEDDLVAGRYRIVRFIASGAMGEVYEARDEELGEVVALKTIRPELAAGPQALERFKREIQLARRVTHPNVCRIFDFGRHQGPPGEGREALDLNFLTMELLRGETLAQYLTRRRRLPLDEVAVLLEQLVAALAAAHAAGVIHRDFKSGNVMLVPGAGSTPRAVVTDFGVARPTQDGDPRAMTMTGVAMGTPAYMAPEQIEGGPVSAATDIYALGIVLYEMITGNLPFRGNTVLATMARRLTDAPTPPAEHVADLDPRWNGVVLRCLERDPGHRFAAVTEILDALAGRPVSSPPRLTPPPSRRMVRPRLRDRGARPWVLGGLGLVAAGLAVALFWRPHDLDEGPSVSGQVDQVQVTTSAGLDLHPTFSPDGLSIAYTSDRRGPFEIFIRGVAAGGADLQVTSDGQQNFEPAWSPDGRSIVYHSKKAGGLWLIPARGGTPKQLTPFGSHPSWSPDGLTLVFQSAALVDLAANAVAAMPPSTLWTVPVAGGEPTEVTQAGSPPGGHGSPSWAPDGRRIVFSASDRNRSSLWSVTAQGDELIRLHDRTLYAYDPVVSPDGRRVYYSSVSDAGRYRTWMLPISPESGRPVGEPQPLVSPSVATARHLALSRDGRRIAYSALQMQSNLWSIELRDDGSGGTARALTSENGRNSRPNYSPDGKLIAFERWRLGINSDLWVMDGAGNRARQVTRDPRIDTVASWLPDGQRLIFRSDRGGRGEVWSIAADGSDERRFLTLDQDVDWPRISPDGKKMVFNSRGGGGTVNVWEVATDGGPARQVTADPEFAGFATWSPDGKLLAVQVKRGESTAVGLARPGASAIEPLTTVAGQSWPYSWSPDGERIAFAGQRGDYWNVYWISRKTREERAVTRYERLGAYVRYPAWSPDGTRIAYEYAETTGNVWMLTTPR